MKSEESTFPSTIFDPDLVINITEGREKIALDKMKFQQKEDLQTQKIDSIEDIAELRARVALEKMNKDK